MANEPKDAIVEHAGGISQRKLEANRRNALKSTGPKTATGKRISAQNAIKHGLLAQAAVITNGEGKESEQEFEALYLQLVSELDPCGVLELMLVEKIAICHWRLRRALRCEVGSIRRQLDTLSYDREKSRNATFRSMRSLAPHFNIGLDGTIEGVGMLKLILSRAQSELSCSDMLSAETIEGMVKGFGPDENGIAVRCAVKNKFIEEASDQARKRRHKNEMLNELVEASRHLDARLELLRKNETLFIDAEASRLTLPQEEDLQRILRYETAIERQLYRALDQLERLQRRRQGEHVPVPVRVDVSTDGNAR